MDRYKLHRKPRFECNKNKGTREIDQSVKLQYSDNADVYYFKQC